MTSFFDDKGSGPSAEAELAQLAKDNPDLLKAEPEPADEPQPEPKPEAGPEPKAEAEPEKPAEEQPQPQEGKQPKMVPVAALAEVRAEKQALESRLSQLQGQMEAMQRMFMQGQQQAQPPQDPQQQPPNEEEDPIGALRYTRNQLAQMQQHLQGMAMRELVTRAYQNDAMRFAASEQGRDFAHAYQWLLNSRANELRAGGVPEQMIQQQLQQEEMGIVVSALRDRASPAERAYSLARARGYTGPAPAPKPAAVDPALQEARQKAATGISEGGTTPKGDLTLEEILKLSGAAQDKALAKYEREHVRPKSSLFRN